MKKYFSILFVCSVISGMVEAGATAAVVARQRWPFSSLVDIDVKLDSSTCSDAVLTATYDGVDTPISIEKGLVSGSTVLSPGINRLVWDPSAAGLGQKKLKNFSVQVTLIPFADRRFLVFDLKDRSYSYYSADPEGLAWNDAKYKSRYIVFRRVPAGVYQLGYTVAQMDRLSELGAGQGYRTQYEKCYLPRTVAITKDYYIAIFQLTRAQEQAISWHSEKSAGSVGYEDYYWTDVDNAYSYKSDPRSWRGDPSDPNSSFAWPQDGHTVSMPVCEQTTGKTSGSVVGRFRQLMANGPMNLPPNMVIDLPTEAQWEIAARAGQPTYYADCGTLIDSRETILAYQDAHFVCNDSPIVGTLAPNSWGLYDVLGLNYELTINAVTLDTASSSVEDIWCGTLFIPTQDVDPVGFTCEKNEKLFQISCNVGWGSHGIDYRPLPTSRTCWKPDAANSCAARLCIHLK